MTGTLVLGSFKHVCFHARHAGIHDISAFGYSSAPFLKLLLLTLTVALCWPGCTVNFAILRTRLKFHLWDRNEAVQPTFMPGLGSLRLCAEQIFRPDVFIL